VTTGGFAALLRRWLSGRSDAARCGLGLAIRRPALQSLNTQQTKRRDLFLQARRQRKLGRFGKRTLLLATSLLSSSMTVAHAHTVSVGYEALGGGVFDIWYGTYHSPSKGHLYGRFSSVRGPFDFNDSHLYYADLYQPSGLIDGTTNFYSNAAGTGLTGAPVPITGNGGSFVGTAAGVLSWQGVQFIGIIRPGTYTFTYIPIANPAQVWDPIKTPF